MITFIGINNGCSKFLRLNEKAEFYIRARKDDFSDFYVRFSVEISGAYVFDANFNTIHISKDSINMQYIEVLQNFYNEIIEDIYIDIVEDRNKLFDTSERIDELLEKNQYKCLVDIFVENNYIQRKKVWYDSRNSD